MRPLFTLFVAALFWCAGAIGAAAQGADDPAIGLYRFGDGREVYVEYLPDIDGLALVEFPSGRIRPLRREADARFSFGPSIGAHAPVEARFDIEGDRLRWTEAGRRTRRARRVRFHSEAVSFQNGEVTLAGVLTRPPGRGPFPAVVLLHGGGAQSRDFFWVTHFFAGRGFAVLAYDKRGVGQSSGDWRTASVHDLAADGLAAVAILKARSDIRAERIGLYGASAGGWTAPLAASMAPADVAFVIARSASALPERLNVIYEIEGDMRNAGFDEAALARMRALHRLDIGVTDSGGEGWAGLRAALREASTEPWFYLARLPADLIEASPENQPHIARHTARAREDAIDPPAIWRRLSVPVLIQLGGRDRYVPGPESAAALREALAANPAATVRLYPEADHPMFASPSGYPRDIPQVTHYAENYLGDLDRFVRRMARD